MDRVYEAAVKNELFSQCSQVLEVNWAVAEAATAVTSQTVECEAAAGRVYKAMSEFEELREELSCYKQLTARLKEDARTSLQQLKGAQTLITELLAQLRLTRGAAPVPSVEGALREASEAKSELLGSLNLHCDKLHLLITAQREECKAQVTQRQQVSQTTLNEVQLLREDIERVMSENQQIALERDHYHALLDNCELQNARLRLELRVLKQPPPSLQESLDSLNSESSAHSQPQQLHAREPPRVVKSIARQVTGYFGAHAPER